METSLTNAVNLRGYLTFSKTAINVFKGVLRDLNGLSKHGRNMVHHRHQNTLIPCFVTGTETQGQPGDHGPQNFRKYGHFIKNRLEAVSQTK